MGLITAMTLTCGIVLAQADLPNANLPGNSPTLPNSNLPGPVTTDHPVMLPNTDTSGYWPAEWQAQRAQETNNAQWMAMHEATMRLAISVDRLEGDALVEGYKRMVLRELAPE